MSIVLLLIAGCTSTDPGAAVPGPGPSVAHAPGLFVAERAPFGRIVIDGAGFVLYRYDGDEANPSRSACVDSCAREWLVVPASPDLRVVGIDRQQVGQLARSDGTVQLTLAGWPLYGYSGDKRPGDINGQGAAGRWHLISPDGDAVASMPTAG